MSLINDNPRLKIEFSDRFDRWLLRLKDRKAAARITERLLRLSGGHWGDVKPVGDGVSEMRIDSGPGYRLYALRRSDVWIVMLGGGDKSSQGRDIEAAKRLAKEYGRAD